MEYAQMINEPSLISGLSTLLKDQDVAVVKRTIRVFANVYRHSLQFLAKGQLDEQTFTNAWPVVHGIGNQLCEMLMNSENEGLTIHIVRFLEASVVAKLLSDISRYPSIASKMGETINVGIKSLKDLLLLPYVGGSSFIVGMRSIITIACYKSSIRKEVVDLIENLIAKPPPTLFDHHVRSLHKVLQRNLFRLLRREEGPEERERLIDMMVKVGVPRRMLSQWAPQLAGRKRSNSNSDEDSDGSTQSQKKRKHENKDYRCPPMPGFPQARLPSLPPGSPPALPPGSPPALPPGSPPALPPALPPGSPPDLPPAPPPGSPPPSPPGSPPSTDSPRRFQNSTSVPDLPNLSSHYDQLKEIFSNIRSQKTTKEEIIFDALENPDVVELVMTCIDEVSDAHVEEELMANLAKAGDESEMREILSVLLVKILPTSITDSIQCVDQNLNNSNKLTDPRLSHVTVDRKEKDSSLTSRRSDSANESVGDKNIHEKVSNSQNNDERDEKLSKDYSDFINSIETSTNVSDQSRETDNTIPTSSNIQSFNNSTHSIQDYDHRNSSMPPYNNGNPMTDNPNMGNRQMPAFNGPRGMFDNSCNFNIPGNMNHPRMGGMMPPPQGMRPPMNGDPYAMGQMGFPGHHGAPMHHMVPGGHGQPGPPGPFMGGYPPPMMPNSNPHWLPRPDLHFPMNSQPNMMNRTPMRM